MTELEIEDRTEGYMDINRVRTGAILICPVKVISGGVCLGVMHAIRVMGR